MVLDAKELTRKSLVGLIDPLMSCGQLALVLTLCLTQMDVGSHPGPSTQRKEKEKGKPLR